MFTFIDLFAGIGGFHAALSAAGGRCVFASEIDQRATRVYEQNWGHAVAGDIIPLTDPRVSRTIPKHDVLTAGFPCQPFSKSGFQRGMDETRGTLFFNIERILEARRPPVILLENVRNLAGPRHVDTWATIIRHLRELGYKVSSTPTVFSPHFLPPELGGAPQVRDRVFILGTYVGPERAKREVHVPPVVPRSAVGDWDVQSWDLEKHLLQPDAEVDGIDRYRLSAEDERIIDVWDEFVARLLEAREGERLPGFPIWADEFRSRARIPRGTPTWKAAFLRKNSEFYREYADVIETWLAHVGGLGDLPPSRRKLEWQAQDTGSLWDCVLHFRPSGIRAKKPTYLPALVAITQTSIIGSRRRRITPREAARLQGLPDWFSFEGQSDADTYKQLGNGVSVGAAYYVLRQHVRDDADVPEHVRASVEAAGDLPMVPVPAMRSTKKSA
jgi:DNA (cytosine-5)-methyltransferase 1